LSAAGVVTALNVEARTLGAPIRCNEGLLVLSDGTLVAVSGMGGAAAAATARILVDAGATALVSWGMAGGLDPALCAGTICLPSVVIAGDGAAFATDPHWRGLVASAIASRHVVVSGRLLASDAAIADVAGKAAAFRATGAIAVDMESSGIAGVAAANGLPFIAVRVIVDTAGDALPGAVMAATGIGQVRILRLLFGILKSPGDIARLLKLAQRYRTAIRALIDVARTGALVPA
jgi:adenosylhomocysteine nucleosidase